MPATAHLHQPASPAHPSAIPTISRPASALLRETFRHLSEPDQEPVLQRTRLFPTTLSSDFPPGETLEIGRSAVRALAELVPADDRLPFARTLCSRILESWWAELQARLGCNLPLRPHIQPYRPLPLPPWATELSDALGRAASTFDTENAIYRIGLIYTAMLPRAHRARYGVYYTPPDLTARLIDRATDAGVDWRTCRVLDPACGGGAFIAPVARHMLKELAGPASDIILSLSHRLRGYEIDPFSAWLSQITLDATLLPLTVSTGIRLPVVVSVSDTLMRNPPRHRFDLVIGNPPYGRIRLSPDARARFDRSLFGHANLYGLFTDAALRHTRKDGVVAYVTPTSFLSGEYFKNLRRLLGRYARPLTLDFVADRRGVFDGVLQETLLATYKKGFRGPVELHEFRPLTTPPKTQPQAITRYRLPRDPSQLWILPRTPEQLPLVHILSKHRARLRHWGYKVSTGPLVWNRHKSRIFSRPAPDRYPLVWADTVCEGGRFQWPPSRHGPRNWFELPAQGAWLLTSTPCVLLQRTTAKEQPRRLIAAPLPAEFLTSHGGAVVENHLNMLRPVDDDPKLPPAIVAAFLNSSAADRAFRCINGSVAVSAYELESLPLPAPDELASLTGIVTDGSSQDDIEAECRRLYGQSSR